MRCLHKLQTQIKWVLLVVCDNTVYLQVVALSVKFSTTRKVFVTSPKMYPDVQIIIKTVKIETSEIMHL